ncbi:MULTISPECIES: hypothetical protein [Saliphagus]|uniref:Uncharacterized protein n=1 Tax=Saliphagus infecundisoli TaxID=1849069 RepID=A0ABD5QJ03_9EURY|nr:MULTISPECIES: hypothetical protein [Saliphagus]
MVLTKLSRGTVGRLLAVLSVLRHAKRAFANGHPLRGIALVVLGVLAWKWALIAFVAGGIAKLIRGRDAGGAGQ